MNILKVISNFKLERLPIDWVEEVWTNGLSSEIELPLEYLEDNDVIYYDIFSSVINAIKSWKSELPGSSTSPKKSWKTLQDLGLDHKPLVCLISSFMKPDYTDSESRILGLVASRVYINLLSIPGAIALNIYHGKVFLKTLTSFKLPKICFVPNDRYKKLTKKGSKHNSIDLCSDDVPEISSSDKMKIFYETGLALCDLCDCFSELRLGGEFGDLCEMIRVMAELTRFEKNVNVFSVCCSKNSSAFIAKKAYDVLYQVCDESQGELRLIIMSIMKNLLHNLSANESNMKMGMFEHGAIKSHTISFIEKLLTIKNQVIEDGVVALFQQLCLRLPDREDLRSKSVPDLVSFASIFPSHILHDCILWLISLMHSDCLKDRIAAAEIIAALINIVDKICEAHQQGSEVPDNNSETNTVKHIYRTFFLAYISKSCDISPLMRSKCLSILCKLVMSKHCEIQNIINNIFILNFEGDKNERISIDSCLFDFVSYFNKNPKAFPQMPLPSGLSLIKLIEYLAKDEKVFVKKNACQFLTNICLMNEKCINKKILLIFLAHCKDSYTSVRKGAGDSLTELVLYYPNNEEIIAAWVDGVLPLIVDNESTISDRAIQHVKSVVFDKIMTYTECGTPENNLPWKVLYIIDKKEKRTLFNHACCTWSKQGIVSDGFISVLESHIGTENNFQVWFLLGSLSQFITVRRSDFIYKYYFENLFAERKVKEYLCLLVLEVLYLNWKGLKSRNQSDMFLQFKSVLENFQVPFPLIARYMDYCFQYSPSETKEWCGILVKKCEAFLLQCISPGSTKHFGENQMCQYIFTLGEAAHFHPGVKSILMEYLANLIDQNFISGVKWIGRKISSKIKGTAIITLGKLCLQDQLAAKTFAPLLGRVLTNPASGVTLKINSMIALSDLCRRFTSVVEDYLGDMCIPLRDQDVHVRKNTLCCLIELVQEDFLKVKGPLFFYLLIMLLDPSSEIKEKTDTFFVNNVKKKTPSVMSQNFIKSVLFFNNFEGHTKYEIERVSDIEKIVFSLAGVNNFNQRGRLYKYMLIHMKDDERFIVCNRLCRDIMEEVCKGAIPLDLRGTAVLKDALNAVSYKEMRLEHLRKTDSEEDNEDAVTKFAQCSFLSTIVKKNYIEHIIPVLAELKQKLMDLKSPLVKDTMVCLRELLKDYKEELNEIMTDPLLATEIALDLRNLELEEKTDDVKLHEEQELKMREIKIHIERLSQESLLRDFGIDHFSLPVIINSSLPSVSASVTPEKSASNSCSPKHTPQSSSLTPVKRQGRTQSSFSSPLSPYANPIPGPSSREDTPVRRQSESELLSIKWADSSQTFIFESPETSQASSQGTNSSGHCRRQKHKKSNQSSQLAPLFESESSKPESENGFTDLPVLPQSTSLLTNCTSTSNSHLTKRKRRRKRRGSSSSSLSTSSSGVEPPEIPLS